MTNSPLFMAIPRDDPEFQQTVVDAQQTLPVFRQLLRSEGAAEWYTCIKTRLVASEDKAFIWLQVMSDFSTGFVARAFELPPEFESFRGKEITVSNRDVVDWMVIQTDVLRGGYSLRYQRAKLPADQRNSFDQRIGVKTYAEPDAAPTPK